MMVDPKKYKEEIKNRTKKELLLEKEKLQNYINNKENNLNSYMKPSYDTIVSVYKEYIKCIDDILNEDI